MDLIIIIIIISVEEVNILLRLDNMPCCMEE